MPEITLEWAWQEMHDAFFDPTPFGTIRSCRRSFKTMGAVRYILEKMLENNGAKGLWVDTINKNIDRYYERYFKPVVCEVTEWNYQKKTLTFQNGSFIDFGSAERPESMEGFEYDYYILNEAGIILKKDALWDNTLKPMFKNAKGGRVVGTPKGKNKFHKLCAQEGWCHYHFTINDCPFYSDEEIDNIRTNSPQEAFRQEYMAEFLDGAGTVFRNIQSCITMRQDTMRQEGARYMMAVDLAKHEDFTVIAIGDADTRELVYLERFNQLDWGIQKDRIKNIHSRYQCENAIIDSTGVGDAIYDDLVNDGLNIDSFKFTASTKTQLIRNLSVALDNRKILFHPYETLINELELYEYSISSMGNMSYNAPEGYHDDCVIALALLNHAFDHAKPKINFSGSFFKKVITDNQPTENPVTDRYSEPVRRRGL